MLGNVRKAGNYVASRGKLFAVLETSWLNSQKDADGTVNMVNNTKDAVYKVGPQGQADMLSDLYILKLRVSKCIATKASGTHSLTALAPAFK